MNFFSSIELPLHNKQMVEGNSVFIVWRRGFGYMPRLFGQHYEDTQTNPYCSTLQNPGLGQNSGLSFCNNGLQNPLVYWRLPPLHPFQYTWAGRTPHISEMLFPLPLPPSKYCLKEHLCYLNAFATTPPILLKEDVSSYAIKWILSRDVSRGICCMGFLVRFCIVLIIVLKHNWSHWQLKQRRKDMLII